MKKVLTSTLLFMFLAIASLGFGATYDQPLYGSNDTNIMGMLDAGKYHTNYLTVTLTGTSATWNTVAAHEIAVVTGAVRMRIWAECTTDLTGATATIELGTANNTAGIIAQTTGTDLDDTEIWVGAAPAVENALVSAGILDAIIVDGSDVGVTIGTAALTAGVIKFHIYWTPLDSTGNVTAGIGGPF